jgi:Tol biopolymer transport system component
MLRLKILASVVPLVIVAVFARGGWSSGPHPCVAIGDASVEIASVPWHADLHVSFTDNPKAATVRVQILESAEAADFAVVDDADNPETGALGTGAPETRACEMTAAPLSVAVAASRPGSAPVIYLSKDGPADYRIFVRSKTFTARDAAALIVGAGDGHHHLTAASL